MTRFAALALFVAASFCTVRATADDIHASPATTAPAASAPAQTKLQRAPQETAIYVSDMHCAGCAKKIAGRLYRLKGVMKVRTDVAADLAIVTPQAKKTIDPKAAWAAVQAVGKHPVKLVGPHGVYVADKKTQAPLKLDAAAAETAAAPATAR
jgi:copper chaperone CopZ